jgi:hypothetical protein
MECSGLPELCEGKKSGSKLRALQTLPAFVSLRHLDIFALGLRLENSRFAQTSLARGHRL